MTVFRELNKYIDNEIATVTQRNIDNLYDDVTKYRENVLKRKIWEEIKGQLADLQQKFNMGDDEL